MTQQNQTNPGSAPSHADAVRLKRTLGLWSLVIIGMVMVQPTAPMGIYGVISNKGHGHVVTTVLIAMVAMLFTAVSYGRMARVYPSAGSAYTYVGQEMHSGDGSADRADGNLRRHQQQRPWPRRNHGSDRHGLC